MIDKTNINPDDVKDIASAKKVIAQLCNLVEVLAADNDLLRTENQKLRDENNCLKGEQGKPDIKGKHQKSSDISSEKERKVAKDRQPKGSKQDRKIDRTETLTVDKSILPADAVFKGYEAVNVQEISITYPPQIPRYTNKNFLI